MIAAAVTSIKKRKSGKSKENRALRVDISWTSLRPFTMITNHQINAIYSPKYGIRQNIKAAVEYEETLKVPVNPLCAPLRI